MLYAFIIIIPLISAFVDVMVVLVIVVAEELATGTVGAVGFLFSNFISTAGDAIFVEVTPAVVFVIFDDDFETSATLLVLKMMLTPFFLHAALAKFVTR